MKRNILLSMLLFVAVLTSMDSLGQQSASSTHLLHKYYDIKNALIAGDASSASKAAGEFLSSLNEAKSNPDDNQALKTNFQGMNDAASAIKAGKNIDKQREAFASLSQAMISLVKSNKPSEKVFVDYCPMKKSSWLSAEQAIKNPYYGSAMLTCGKVTDIIQ